MSIKCKIFTQIQRETKNQHMNETIIKRPIQNALKMKATVSGEYRGL